MVLSVIAADPGSFSQWGAGGAALAILGVSIAVIFRVLYNQAQENKVCNFRLSTLYNALIDAGIRIPDDFKYGPPDLSEKKRRKISMNITRGGSESGATTSLWLSGVALALVFLVGVCAIAYIFVINPIAELRTDSTTDKQASQVDRCNNSLTADYFVAIGLALGAPPDSGERNVYIKLSQDAAERIRHRLDICADGKPDEFKLPEISTR